MNTHVYKLIDTAAFGILFLVFTFYLGSKIRANGRRVINNAFGAETAIASSVDFLLNLGWYLMCFGLLLWNMGITTHAHSLEALLRNLSLKLGISVFTIGVLHGFNLLSLSLLHRKNTP